MCRLYGIRASHPTRVHCELLAVQNSLFGQSQKDSRGFTNPHGWGIGAFRDGKTICRRQADPAHESAAYRQKALSTNAVAVVAHVRRATVGEPRLENTHPFCFENSFLAHNGHVDHFEEVGQKIRDHLPPARREAIEGTTDSEHFFQLVLNEYVDREADSMAAALQVATCRLRRWVRQSPGDGEGGLGLNTLWVYDGKLAGTRLDRTLFMRTRDRACECDVCGRCHAEPGDESYRFVEFASEKLTADEDWERVPDESIFWVDKSHRVQFEPMEDPQI